MGASIETEMFGNRTLYFCLTALYCGIIPFPQTLSQGSCFCGRAKRSHFGNRQQKIIGGGFAEVNEYPWQVLLREANCGGSLISNKWILTAAHCLKTTVITHATLGEHNYKMTIESVAIKFAVERQVIHPKYWEDVFVGFTVFDFGLLELKKKILWESVPHIRPICLPAPDDESYAERFATATGWGTTQNDLYGEGSHSLREVRVKILTNKACDERYSVKISDSMLCAGVPGGGKDTCHGDSGGPLVVSFGDEGTSNSTYQLVGVTSWGIGCGEAEHPGVYARVTSAMDWIQEVAGEDFETCPAI